MKEKARRTRKGWRFQAKNFVWIFVDAWLNTTKQLPKNRVTAWRSVLVSVSTEVPKESCICNVLSFDIWRKKHHVKHVHSIAPPTFSTYSRASWNPGSKGKKAKKRWLFILLHTSRIFLPHHYGEARFVRLHHRLWLHREVSRSCLPSALVNTLQCYCQDHWVREVIIITHKLPRANLNFALCYNLRERYLTERSVAYLRGAKRTAPPDGSYMRDRENEKGGGRKKENAFIK